MNKLERKRIASDIVANMDKHPIVEGIKNGVKGLTIMDIITIIRYVIKLIKGLKKS